MGSVKNIVVFIVTILILLLIYGCATFYQYGKLEQSASLDYQAGNYDLAIFKCVESIKLQPDYDKSQALIKDSLEKSVKKHESRIKELDLSQAKFKWDEIVAEYESLIRVNNAIKSLPNIVDKTKKTITFELKDYTEELVVSK